MSTLLPAKATAVPRLGTGRQPRISHQIKEQVRAATDIVELVSRYVDLRMAGSELKGRCPFHQESNPSFTVSPSRQVFHCFGCKVGGDCYEFVKRILRVGFPEAAAVLAKEAGITIEHASPLPWFPHGSESLEPHTQAQRPQEPLVPIPDTRRLQEFLVQAQDTLWTRTDLQDRWLSKRNLTLEAVKAWGIGFLEVPVSWPVIGRGLKARNVWVLPVCDPRGAIRAIKLHIEDEDFREQQGKSRWACFGLPHPKNNNQRRHAYQTLWPPPEWWFEDEDERAAIMEYHGGTDRAAAERQSGWADTCLYLCPGELKALAVISAGRAATSVTAGESHKWTRVMIARIRTYRLVLIYDDDPAGHRFRDSTLAALDGHVQDLRAITFGTKKETV